MSVVGHLPSQGRERSLKHVGEGMSLALPAPLLWGSSDLQHFGARPDNSELSFSPRGSGVPLSSEGAPCLWSRFFPGWGLSPGGGRARVGHEKVSSGASLRGTSLGGGTVSRPRGSPAGVTAPGEEEAASPPLSEWGGGPCLSRVLGGGVGEGGLGRVRRPHWGRVSLG